MKKHYIIIFCFLCCCICWSGFAQNSKTDSLEKVLATTGQDTNRVIVLIELSKYYLMHEVEKAPRYMDEAIPLAKKINFKYGLAKGYSCQGQLNRIKGNYPESIAYYTMALDIMKQLGRKKEIAKSMRILGETCRESNDYEKAIEYNNEALKICNEIADKDGVGHCYTNLGNIYLSKGQYTEALDNHFKALKIDASLNNKSGEEACRTNIGLIYMEEHNYAEALKNLLLALDMAKEVNEVTANNYINIANVYTFMNDNDKALEYGKQALALINESTPAREKISTYSNVGGVYKSMGNYTEAMHYFLPVLKMALEQDDKYIASTVYNSLGEIAGKQKKYTDAISYFDKGLAMAKEINARQWIEDNYYRTAELYAAMGDYKKAYQYEVTYDQTKDSVLNEENSKEVARLQTQFETEKKEKEIETLHKTQAEQTTNILRQKLIIERRNSAIAVIAAVFTLCLLGGLLTYRQYKKAQDAKLKYAIAQQERIRLQTIMDTEQKERIRIAKDMHDELGSGISKIIIHNEQSKKYINGNVSLNKALISIDNTVQELVGNMNDLIWYLQTDTTTLENLFTKMREFATDFLEESPIELSISFPKKIPELQITKEALRDTYLSFKEAVNNAVKYSKATTLNITGVVKVNQLDITVADNGVGMEIDQQQNKGNGLRNMENRVSKNYGRFTLDSKPGKGTKIRFSLDLEKIKTV